MLDHLGLSEEATRINQAIEATTRQGILTKDLGGTHNTAEITDSIIKNLSKRKVEV